MRLKVPKSIRERVIKQWLLGMSRDQIAKDNDIGTGTVSAITKDAKQEIPDIDLLREVALVLKKEDLDLSLVVSSIRLQKRLDQMDLNEDQVESLIEIGNIHCFKHGLSAEEFVNNINKIVALSQILGIPVEQLPHYITQGKLEMQKVKEETEDAKVKQLQVLQHYNINMNDLEEYRRNKPLVDHIRQLKQMINNLAREIKSKEFEITTLEYKYMTGQQ